MNKRQIRREANYRAGLILESVLNEWDPDDLVARHGQDIVDAISEEIWDIARMLRERGGPVAPAAEK